MIKIRKTNDYETCLALDTVLFPETYHETPEEGNEFWLAWDEDGNPVGFASIRALREESQDPRWSETAILSRVGVLASARQQGLQTRFINCRLRWARKNGFKRVVTYVTWHSVWSARALVKRGFLPYAPPFYFASDVLYLECDL